MKKINIKTARANKINHSTEMVFILDRSGSMAGLESDTIGGFNAMIEKQKKQPGKAYVSTVLFDTSTTVLHDRADLTTVKPMTSDDYFAGGCTALLDAIGGAINHIGNIHKYARPEDIPAHTIFVITTDGLENASRQYSKSDIKRMIERQRTKYGWEFLFIGANIDAIVTAESFGIEQSRAVNYHADKKGTKVLYDAISAPLTAMRSKGRIDDNWSEEIEEDFNNRK